MPKSPGVDAVYGQGATKLLIAHGVRATDITLALELLVGANARLTTSTSDDAGITMIFADA